MSSARNFVRVVRLGRIGYASALERQNAFARRLLDADNPRSHNALLLLEHDPVYTIGLRSTGYSDDLATKLRLLGAEFVRTNRGGLITFHGPGQLVAYPIVNLKCFNLGMKAYVCKLQKTIIKTCERYGLKADTTEYTGVWIGENKIAAIGVHGRKFVTTHGLALNCDIDLTWFDHIIPCGIEGKGVTSLSKELEKTVTVEEASSHLTTSFADIFDCVLVTDESCEY